MKYSLSLHIKIVSDTSDIKEWHFNNPKKITIGYLSNAMITVPHSLLKPSEILFCKRKQKICLCIHDDTEASLVLHEKNIPIRELRRANFLHKDKTGEYLVLVSGVSGTIEFGNLIFEFWTTQETPSQSSPWTDKLLSLSKEIPYVVLLTLFMSLVFHWIAFRLYWALPQPELTILEVQNRYAKFEPPSADFVRQQLQKIEDEYPKKQREEIPQVAERKKRPPVKSKMAKRFLAAVTRASQGRQASAFASLFKTDSLGRSLDVLLKETNLEKTVESEAEKLAMNTPRPNTHPQTLEIGNIRQPPTLQNDFKISLSNPTVTNLSSSTTQSRATLDLTQLERQIASLSGQLRDCYERLLSHNSKLAGRLVVSLTISQQGLPSDITIEEASFHDWSFEQCIKKRVSSWVLPKPTEGPVPIRLPFIFSASSRG